MLRNFSRRTFLRSAALGSVGLALAPHLRGQSARLPRKPNLIVFLPDQQRADTLACYGAPRTLTPNLDRLASQSFAFQRAYVAQPVCTPSRSSLLTGVWPHENGCTHNDVRLDPHLQCLPEMVADSDYQTAYMGKWHLGEEDLPQHGFDDWVSIIDRRFSPERNPHKLSDYGRFLVSQGVTLARNKSGSLRKFETRLPLELSKPKFLELEACDFLERHQRDPFILFVAFFEPHPPYNGPLNDEVPVDEKDLDPTSNEIFGDDMPLRYRMRQHSQRRKVGETPAKQLKIKQRYLGLVTQVDRSIGAILTKLEQLGLADNTIVVHTSDHGDMMGAHRLIGKGVMFEEAVRVPYLIRLPEQRRAIAIHQPVSHIDFAPTMIDLLGKQPNEQCIGRSRAPLLRGESMSPQTLFVQWNPGVRRRGASKASRLASSEEVTRAMDESTRTAIFPEGWKLSLRDTDSNELYDLHHDPREQRNLYHTASREVLSRLTGEIHRWQESARDSAKV